MSSSALKTVDNSAVTFCTHSGTVWDIIELTVTTHGSLVSTCLKKLQGHLSFSQWPF